MFGKNKQLFVEQVLINKKREEVNDRLFFDIPIKYILKKINKNQNLYKIKTFRKKKPETKLN